MLTLIRIELFKIFKKWRTYIGFIAVATITLLVQLALYLGGAERQINYFTRGLQEAFLFVGNFFNGYLIGYIVMQALFVQIPFLIVLVGGDLLASEATAGTYRILITRPITRFQIITSKYIAGAIYTVSLLLFLGFMSLGLSCLLFGTGELIVFANKLIIFATSDILWRFLLAYCYAILSMLVVFSLSYLFSSLVENAIGPIIATMAVIIVFLIISVLPIDVLENIKPFLFTSYIAKWGSFFDKPIDYWNIINSGLVLLVHAAGFYFITLYIFNKKDILT